MTEQEIIDFLKKNKEKGIAFPFMPKEIRDWICENYYNPELLYFDQKAEWKFFDKIDDDDNCSMVVFSLPDDYKVKKEPKGEWVEFDINEKGQFLVIFTQGLRYYFNWFAWWRLLEKSIDYNYGFTAFGGWQYKDSKNWYQYPILLKDNGQVMLGSNDGDNVKPAIPIKIRFWREK